MVNVKFLIALIAAFFAASSAAAGSFVGAFAVTETGIGARSFSMGNNYVSFSNDASAMFFNPAGLAFAPVREVSFGLSGLVRTAGSSVDGAGYGTSEEESHRSRVRLGNVSLVRAFPATRGGCAIALGYGTPYILDDILDYHGYSIADGLETEILENLTSYGQLNFLTGSFGIQIASNLGAGVSASFVSGSGAQSYTSYVEENSVNIDNYQETLRQSYAGIDVRAGLMYSIPGILSVGLRIQAPQYIVFRENSDAYDWLQSSGSQHNEYLSKGTMQGTAAGAVGISGILPFMKATAEVRGYAPHPDAAEGSILSYWRAGAGVGLEAPLMLKSLLLRAGYSWSEYNDYPFRIQYSEADDITSKTDTEIYRSFNDYSGQHTTGGGLAWLTSSGISFEAAYAFRFWTTETYSDRGVLTENHGMHRILASISVRY
jgi:hypothetical protein